MERLLRGRLLLWYRHETQCFRLEVRRWSSVVLYRSVDFPIHAQDGDLELERPRAC